MTEEDLYIKIERLRRQNRLKTHPAPWSKHLKHTALFAIVFILLGFLLIPNMQ